MAISSVRSPTSAVTFFSKEQEKPHHDHCPLCIDSMVQPADDKKCLKDVVSEVYASSASFSASLLLGEFSGRCRINLGSSRSFSKLGNFLDGNASKEVSNISN